MALEDEGTLPEENSPEPVAENYEQRFKDTQAAFTKSQQALKDAESIWEDEETLISRIRERYPDWVAEDDAPVATDESFVEGENPPPVQPHDPRLDEILPQFQALQEAEAERQYHADLASLTQGREIPEKGRKLIRDAVRANGDNRKALESAVNEWFELFPVEEAETKTKKTNHVIVGGREVNPAEVDWSKMSESDEVAYMSARARALENNT